MGHKSTKGEKEKENSQTNAQDEAALMMKERRKLQEDEKFIASLVIKPLVLPDTPTIKPEGAIRFVVLSDTHNQAKDIKSIPDGDVLVHAGDFTDNGYPEEIEAFVEFMRGLPHKHKLVVAGNHDVTLCPSQLAKIGSYMLDKYSEKDLKNVRPKFEETNCCTYLDNEEVEIEGIKIYGVPWIFEKKSEILTEHYSKIPKDVDVLITHAPPYGYGDVMAGTAHSGQLSLCKAVTLIQPAYHVYGHAHEGYGCYTNNVTSFINGAICTRDLQPTNLPIVFDLFPEKLCH